MHALFPGWLLSPLGEIQELMNGEVFLAGGTVRDLLLGKKPQDIDLTVRKHAKKWARMLADRVGGAYVPLGRNEDAARVVFRGTVIDFSSFRLGAETIREELAKRDITINSLALEISCLLDENCRDKVPGPEIIDPCGGADDLGRGLIRMTFSEAFVDDPLRLLRVFRFAALMGFEIDSETREAVTVQRELIGRVAPERIQHELELIMASAGAADAVSALAECGLLWEVLPQLGDGVGVRQPSSHHLDVFLHNVETLRQMEVLFAIPDRGFGDSEDSVAAYLRSAENRVQLNWSALLHDIGKPAVYAVDRARDDRITFYNHDHVGVDIVRKISTSLRWSKKTTEKVGLLIAHHMRPFHLVNSARQGPLTTKACIRLAKSVGDDLPGLFLLAMADAAAGQGEQRPPEIEQELVALYRRIEQVKRENMAPVLEGPTLLSGRDLIGQLQLKPGPIFKKIINAVTEARMEGLVTTREEALAMARELAAREDIELMGDGEKEKQ